MFVRIPLINRLTGNLIRMLCENGSVDIFVGIIPKRYNVYVYNIAYVYGG
jgi:hypothetical protein